MAKHTGTMPRLGEVREAQWLVCLDGVVRFDLRKAIIKSISEEVRE